MNSSVLMRGTAYILLAILGVWASFFTQYYEAWLQEPNTQLIAPWFVWTSLGINSVVQAVIVFRAFLDGSVERNKTDVK